MNWPTQSLTSSILLLASLVLVACSSIPTIPISGQLFGEQVTTTVDSEIARYYFESYLMGGNRKNPEMDSAISAIYNRGGPSIPSRSVLRDISQQYSVDFAALFLADRLLKNECNQALNRYFLDLLNRDAAVDFDPSSYLVLFVPGWDYAELGYLTGADFAKPRRLATDFQLENYLIELPPTGGVEENAEIILADISRYSQSGKKIVLVGASSAGPAIHLALSNRVAAKAHNPVKVWLNVGGILQGSPIIDHYQSWHRRWFFNLVLWYEGWDKEAVLSMSTKLCRRRISQLQIDPDILVINYLGIPLSGQVSRYSRENYRLLRPRGPNDGLTLLTDAIAPNSLTIVALGSDHFFAEDPRVDKKTVALIKLLISYQDSDLPGYCAGN
jgi:hypothetical protein